MKEAPHSGRKQCTMHSITYTVPGTAWYVVRRVKRLLVDCDWPFFSHNNACENQARTIAVQGPSAFRPGSKPLGTLYISADFGEKQANYTCFGECLCVGYENYLEHKAHLNSMFFIVSHVSIFHFFNQPATLFLVLYTLISRRRDTVRGNGGIYYIPLFLPPRPCKSCEWLCTSLQNKKMKSKLFVVAE